MFAVISSYCTGLPNFPPNVQGGILPNASVGLGTVVLSSCADGYVNGSLGWPSFTCVANTSTSGSWSASGNCDRADQHYLSPID